jgi:hypothetical protein
MRTSLHHQPEAQHPNFPLSTSWQADYPIFCAARGALGRLALKFRRHFPQSASDPEVKGGSGHGNKNFCLLPQVCTTSHWPLFGNWALFHVNDISPTSFQISQMFRGEPSHVRSLAHSKCHSKFDLRGRCYSHGGGRL